jgi:hypothetical protein
LDGAEDNVLTSGVIASVYDSSVALTFGAPAGGLPAQYFFDGAMQHAQLHSSARSADWIALEYDQTNNNATFWGTWTWNSGQTHRYTPSGSAGTLIF